MPDFLSSDRLADMTMYDQEGGKVGRVGQAYAADGSGRPEWVTVITGLFGTRETFVPLAGAEVTGDQLRVPFTREHIKAAPNADADGHLTHSEGRRLYDHYGLPGAGTPGRESVDSHSDAQADRAGEDAELVRSEERLHVGTEEDVVGVARLRKVVVTEHVTTTIPVSHEEVRVVREPVRSGDPVHARIAEDEAEVTLHAERPVVAKEQVAVERVRLETERVSEQQEVSATVRKERIDVDDEPGTTAS